MNLVIPELRGRRTAVVGVGSELNGDDAAGLLVARYLKKKIEDVTKSVDSLRSNSLFVIEAGSAPENYSGPIRKIRPEILLFADAADMSLPVGTIRWIRRGDISGFSGSTHLTPLVVLADFLSNELQCDCYFLGIQPESMEFDHNISPSVRRAARKAAGRIFSNFVD